MQKLGRGEMPIDEPTPPPPADMPVQATSRCGRITRPTQRLIEIMEAKMEKIRPSFVTFETK